MPFAEIIYTICLGSNHASSSNSNSSNISNSSSSNSSSNSSSISSSIFVATLVSDIDEYHMNICDLIYS